MATGLAVPFSSGHLLFLSPPQQVGSFFMINLCLVVIATQFSETKQREHRLMLEQRQRYLSSSTVASYAEPGDCYEEIFQYVCHILRKARRRALGLYQALQSRRQGPAPGAPTSIKPGPHAKEPRHYSKWPAPAASAGATGPPPTPAASGAPHSPQLLSAGRAGRQGEPRQSSSPSPLSCPPTPPPPLSFF